MKKAILIGLVWLGLATSFPALAAEQQLPVLAKQAKSADAFVPKGWRLLDKATGDLNKDGLADLAGVLEPEEKWDPATMEQAPVRILFVAFAEKGQAGYRLSIQTTTAILRADEGGVFGDPYVRTTVNRGSVLLEFYGGSSSRWGSVYRFRYQNQGWYLIGVTNTGYHTGTMEGTTEDYNLLTGVLEKSQTKEERVTSKQVIQRGKKKLVNLKDFRVGEEQF